MSALENDLPVVQRDHGSHVKTGDEQAALSPAPIVVAQARALSARGIKDASEPMGRAIASDHTARTLKVAPEPIAVSEASALSARVHAVGSTPMTGANAKLDTASTHDTVPSVVQTSLEGRMPAGEGWIELRMCAEMFYDVQKTRIGCQHRIARAAVQGADYGPMLDRMKTAEAEFAKDLRECYRRVVPEPIRAWQMGTPGIGEPALARLLGHVGNPAIAEPYHWEETPDGDDKRILVADEPYERSLRQLWAYCGHGDPARRRVKGMEQDDALAMGSPLCKMLVHQLLAVSCMKATGGDVEIAGKTVTRARSPYRDVYEQRREETADREGWTPGHQHNDALRITGKEILRDLWVASRMEKAS